MDAISAGPRRFRGLPRTMALGFGVPVATTRRARLLGLALLDRERAEQGLLIPHCRSVHTFGMRFPLDLVFLSSDGLVVEARRAVPGGRIVRCGSAAAVLELPTRDP
jgi:uncharacterized protein